MTNLRLIVLGVVVIIGGIVALSARFTQCIRPSRPSFWNSVSRGTRTRPGLHAKLPWRTATYYDKRILSLTRRRSHSRRSEAN